MDFLKGLKMKRMIFAVLLLTNALGCSDQQTSSALNDAEGDRLDALFSSIKDDKFYDRDVRKNLVELLRDFSDDGDALYPKSIDKLMARNNWTDAAPTFADDIMIRSEEVKTDVAHLNNSAIFATGDVKVSHAADVVTVAYGSIKISHVNSQKETTCLLIASTDIELGHAKNCLIFAGGKVTVSSLAGSRVYARGDIKISWGDEDAPSYVISTKGKVDAGKGISVKKVKIAK